MPGREHPVCSEPDVLQHARELPVHRDSVSTQLPEGSHHRVKHMKRGGTAEASFIHPSLAHLTLNLLFDSAFADCFSFCLKNCPPNDLECALSPYAVEYKLLALPFGIAANQDLIRLVAYTQDGVMHPRTTFLAVDEDAMLPFTLRDENMKGVLFTTQALREPRTYRMKVRALSYSQDGGIEYQTTFIVYLAVSIYPY